ITDVCEVLCSYWPPSRLDNLSSRFNPVRWTKDTTNVCDGQSQLWRQFVMTATTKTKKVPPGLSINISGHYARVQGVLVRKAASLLTVATKEVLSEGGVTRIVNGEPIEHFNWNDDGSLDTRAGLVPRIQSQLLQQGFEVRTSDFTRWMALEAADNQWRSRIGL